MKKLRDYRNPRNDRRLSFWGPAGIALGVTLILLDAQITTESINFALKAPLEVFNLAAGIILIVVLGLLALYLISQDRKVALARVGLGSGIPIFFWGTHVFNALHETNAVIGYGVGWPVIVVGLVLIIMGYVWAPK